MEISVKEITIKTAAFRTRCFVCQATILQGENYAEIEDERECVKCGLPARRLRPLNKETINSPNNNNQHERHQLQTSNH
jgi:Zn ribbon nucleic-acid-binding protein